MRKRVFIALVSVMFFLLGCDEKEVDIVPGSLYSVTTTEGNGFAVLDHVGKNKWSGIYYLSRGQLTGVKRKVELVIDDKLSFVDEENKKISIISYSPYHEPEFKDYPETWTYRDSAYSVTVKKNVVYGHAQGYWVSYPDSDATYTEIFNAKEQELDQGKKEQELTMDVYLPNDNKEASRPLLVLIHGGAFFNGDKADLGFPEWANYFACRGYVVASVNYRLGFKKSLSSIKRAGIRAVQDIDAAIRYILHYKGIYAVDPNRVFVAGTSAGGITALNVAFMRDENVPSDAQELGGIKSVNPEIKESYNIRAVGNMWGAVNDLSILDNASSSVISFHNTGDPVVPFSEGHPFKKIVILNLILFPTMYGSEKITEHLGNQRAALVPYDLSNKHTLHTDKDKDGKKILNSQFYEIETGMCDYFSDVMLPSPVTVKHTDNSQTFQLFSSDIDSVYWCVEGGAFLRQEDCHAEVLLFPDAALRSVVVCGKYKSGLTFRHQWNL